MKFLGDERCVLFLKFIFSFFYFIDILYRYFTHSTEFVIWARKNARIPHYYDYDLMKLINNGKQMTDVWRMPAIAQWEKSCGKHPTQKPLALLTRIILASTRSNAWILDPFSGSSTTGIAASLVGRRFLGIEVEKEYLELSRKRRDEINDYDIRTRYLKKIKDTAFLPSPQMVSDNMYDDYGLPF